MQDSPRGQRTQAASYPTIPLAERGRAAMVGLAVGHALGLASHKGDDGKWVIDRQATPSSPHHADVALPMLTAEVLTGATVDVRTLALRWADWLALDGRGASPSLRAALTTLRDTGVPPATGDVAGVEPMLRAIPVALKVHASARNLVSAPAHLGALTHPDPRATWAAVAVAVALARILAGHRDFIADVIEVLRVNDAPHTMIAAARRIPLRRWDEVREIFMAGSPAEITLEAALFAAYHAPRFDRGCTELAQVDTDRTIRAAACGVAGALLAARDGQAQIPADWMRAVPGTDKLAALGEQLVMHASPGGD